MPRAPRLDISLTTDELELVVAALDSHVYWQLSDREYRDSGYVHGKGSGDRETAKEIRIANKLQERLASLIPAPANNTETEGY